jgi:hypothetical protein
MGIYIVKSLHSEWIKIGHFKTTDVKPSVYYQDTRITIVFILILYLSLHHHTHPIYRRSRNQH